MTSIEQIQAAIEAEATVWANTFILQRKSFLENRKIVATGDLKESLKTETIRQASAQIIETLIEFEESGRFVDMKTLRPSKGGDIYIRALEQWLKDKGFFQKNRAKYEAKYESNRKFQRITSGTTRDSRALNRMAWSIAITRASGKYRKRRWYNKPKSAAIGELFNRIAANLPSIANEAIINQFQ
jgi:hypothetical protein